MADRRDILILFFYLVLLGIAMAPVLFGGWVFAHTDAFSLFYPYYEFYHDAIQTGQSFLWSPWIFSGSPVYLTQNGGFLDPVNRVLFSYADGTTGVHLRLFLDYLLVLVFSYAAGRVYGLSRLASSAIGLGYLVSIHMKFLSTMAVANGLFLTPFLIALYGILRDARGWRKAFLIFCMGLGTGWVLLGSLTQVVVYGLSLFGALVFFEEWRVRNASALRAFLKTAGLVAAITAIGGIIALPHILPVLAYVPLSIRAEGVAPAIALARNITPGDFLSFLFPNYSYFPYVSVGTKTLYVGAFLFFAAFIGVYAVLTKEKRGIPALAAFLLALAIAISYSPLAFILQQLPLFNLFRYVDRWMWLGTFYLAFLGAFGFDAAIHVVKTRFGMRFARGIGIVAGVLAVLILALNFLGGSFWARAGAALHSVFSTFLYGWLGYGKDPTHYADAIQRGIAAWREFTSLSDPAFLVPFLLLIASAALFMFFIRGAVPPALFRGVGMVLISVAFLSSFRASIAESAMPLSLLGERGAAFAPLMTPEEKEQYRVFPFMLDAGFSEVSPPTFKQSNAMARVLAEIRYAAGWPNANTFAAASADGYDPFLPSDLFRALVQFGSTHGGQYETENVSREERVRRLLASLEDIGEMSGKYIVSGVPLSDRALTLRATHRVSQFAIPLYVYENAYARPRISFAPGARAEIISSVRANGFFEITARAEVPTELLVRESYLPGWRAERDGDPVEILRAGEFFMALPVPIGTHIFHLSYEGIRGEAPWLRAVGFLP